MEHAAASLTVYVTRCQRTVTAPVMPVRVRCAGLLMSHVTASGLTFPRKPPISPGPGQRSPCDHAQPRTPPPGVALEGAKCDRKPYIVRTLHRRPSPISGLVYTSLGQIVMRDDIMIIMTTAMVMRRMQGLLVNESMTVMQNKITEPSIDSGTHPSFMEVAGLN